MDIRKVNLKWFVKEIEEAAYMDLQNLPTDEATLSKCTQRDSCILGQAAERPHLSTTTADLLAKYWPAEIQPQVTTALQSESQVAARDISMESCFF